MERCGLTVALAAQDIERWSAVKDAAYEVDPVMGCLLAPHHSGDHATPAQSSLTPDRDWWTLRETGSPYRIVQLPRCTIETGLDIDGEPLTCGLYGCHGGERS
ncbi:hypothetical protein ACFC8F_03005 [Streptomyces hydrogenans]|uniref:hypothetical protein n=1 Tax=Streptomyces hydrogenans TaxID=1873719 RepID=UPI0035DF4A47